MTRTTTFLAGIGLIAVLLLLPSGALAAKGGNGGGKPGGGGEPTAASPEIAYASEGNVMVMDADGSNATVVVSSAGTLVAPVWSPDGTRLAFAGDVSGTGIYVVDLDGSNLTKIRSTATEVVFLAWSPVATADGAYRIAFADYPSDSDWTDIHVIDEDGSNLLNLTGTPNRGEAHPTWNASATALAVNASWMPAGETATVADLRVLDLTLSDGDLTVGTDSGYVLGTASDLDGARLSSPEWARTGDEILLAADVGDGYTTLWVLDLDGADYPTQIYSGASGMPSWSPDDTEVVYFDGAGRKRERGLHVRTVGGTTSTKLTDKSASRPNWKR